ncbi:hypothetical protein F5146DRAFT_1005530 [Armillaria mellea]|nr:hypothetical protein F5146DRAFT_1005530 [Armillaria mellea]
MALSNKSKLLHKLSSLVSYYYMGNRNFDLEAGVDSAQDIESSSENESSFIGDDEEYSDDTADLGPVTLSPATFPQDDNQLWRSLLERAKAAFVMPHIDKQVWLEAEISSALKAWLVDIPETSQHTLWSILSRLPLVNGMWVKVHRRSQFKGKVGMVAKVYPWGCKVLLVPTLNTDALPELKHKQRLQSPYFGPKLFNHMVIASEISNQIVTLFGQSRHPQVCKHIQGHPRVSEWCFQVREKVTQVEMSQSGSIHTIGEDGLDVQFAEVLFLIRWADVRKEFKVGQYVQITEGDPADRWGGLIQAFDGNPLQLISGSNSDDVKGTRVLVNAQHNIWHGKTGEVIDINIMMNTRLVGPVLQILVQLDHYDANAPFPSCWFPYLNVVEANSWLPLNEAQPMSDTDSFFSSQVHHTNILQEKGRHIPPQHIKEEEPGNATPWRDPSE